MQQESTKPVTIYDIARRTGVSSATVARVLKGGAIPAWKSAAQRAAQIRQVAEEMGYRPNLRARALATGRSQCVGLLYERTTVYVDAMSLLSHVAEACQRRDYDLMLIPAVGEADQWVRRVHEHRVDGCLVTFPMPHSLDVLIRERRVPLVLMNIQTDLEATQVLVDDRDGARQAVEHLVSLGHRRIGYFNRPKEAVSYAHYSMSSRKAGYREAMVAAGLGSCIREYEQTVDDFASMFAGTPASDRPSALLCYVDAEAQMVASELWQRGLNVPADLSLVGFNDEPWSARAVPPLTSVALPWAKLADTSAELLLRQIEGDADVPRRSILGEKLIVRSSTTRIK